MRIPVPHRSDCGPEGHDDNREVLISKQIEQIANLEAKLAAVKRQNGDLQAANNVYLMRARGAEDQRFTAQDDEQFERSINAMVLACHASSVEAGWYTDLATGGTLKRNVGELLCLIHSEVSEAMEGYRKSLMDDKIPSRPMIEVELADALIRICDLAGYLHLDLGGAYVAKRAFNAVRKDHQIEHRRTAGGKAF